MNIKFKNKQINLNRLNDLKVREIVSKVVKDREDQFKKHLNDIQINHTKVYLYE
jgi:hypothetical protein